MILRPYQTAAVDAVWRHLRERDDSPCVVLPTAAGKTPVMATICKEAVGRWKGRVLILAHVKELLQQSADKLNLICPEINVGIYSAGIGRRDTEHPVIVAGIQSVYRRAEELGAFDLIMIDESHLIPAEGEGMYRSFLDAAKGINGRMRVIGLTATPYRMTSGAICSKENFLNHVCYEIGVKELIVQGFLCPLVSKAGRKLADLSDVHMSGGEFIASEAEGVMDENGLVSSACTEIVCHTKEDRKSVLIFACGVSHALHIANELEKLGEKCEMVCGDTPDGERADILARFKSGSLKYLANVNVLTTGFDAPNIDCVAMVRPTMSPGIYYQMVGRGFRICEGKANCLVLDYGGNVMRHGPIDAMRIDDHDRKNGMPMAKTCPNCQLICALGCAICPGCGHNFPPREDREINHDSRASDAKILDEDTLRELPVQRVSYRVHKKKNADDDAPKTLRVTYRVGLTESISEWICIEHNGRPGMSARQWWQARTKEPYPSSAAEAVEIAAGGGLKEATKITAKHTAGEYFDRIVSYVLGDARPVALLPEEADEIPF